MKLAPAAAAVVVAVVVGEGGGAMGGILRGTRCCLLGRVFYINHKDKTTSWTFPGNDKPPGAGGGAPSPNQHTPRDNQHHNHNQRENQHHNHRDNQRGNAPGGYGGG
ncbi:hypothetical protein T484DRAFT_1826923, partial [Baffinella frigidus]